MKNTTEQATPATPRQIFRWHRTSGETGTVHARSWQEAEAALRERFPFDVTCGQAWIEGHEPKQS